MEGWQQIKVEDPTLSLARKQLYGGLIVGIMGLFVSAIIYFPYALLIWKMVGALIRMIGSLFLFVLMILSCVAFSDDFSTTVVYSTSFLESGLIGTWVLIRFMVAILVFGGGAVVVMPKSLLVILSEE